MNAFVTGGTGFLGTALVRHLLGAGYKIRILARQRRNIPLFDNPDIEIVEGSLSAVDAIKEAMRGCDVVFHLAGKYALYPFWEKQAQELYETNVNGTVNMLKCALANNIKLFIHTSTIAVIGKEPDGKPSSEKTGFDEKLFGHYERSKYLAETKVLEFCGRGLDAVILNPAIIMGEGDYKPTPSGDIICKFLNRKYPGYFRSLWSIADVDDVARMHIAAVEHGRPGERYIICDDRQYTLKEIFGILEEVSGVKAPRIHVPYPILSAFVHIEEFLSMNVFKKKPLMPTEGVKYGRNAITFDNSKAVNGLGYSPAPIKETLTKAVKWYKENGYVKT